MQNNPHDSICGCSVDEVHREMDTRFEKSAILSRQLCHESLQHLAEQTDTSAFDDALAAVVAYNPSPQKRLEPLEIQVDLPEDDASAALVLRDAAGNELPTHLLADDGVVWDYTLPDIGFRETHHTRRRRLAVEAELPAGGLACFGVYPQAAPPETRKAAQLENEYLRVDLHPDGTFDLLDKTSGRLFKDQHRLEDSLDCGDEYNFRIPDDDVFCHPRAEATRIGPIEDNGVFSQCRIETEVQARDTRLPITYILRLGRRSRRLEVGLRLENRADNHRLRAVINWLRCRQTPQHVATGLTNLLDVDRSCQTCFGQLKPHDQIATIEFILQGREALASSL